MLASFPPPERRRCRPILSAHRTTCVPSRAPALKGLIGEEVTVELRNEAEAHGKLTAADAQMNLTLEDVTYTKSNVCRKHSPWHVGPRKHSPSGMLSFAYLRLAVLAGFMPFPKARKSRSGHFCASALSAPNT